MSEVKITVDATGNIVCGGKVSEKDGKEYGFIRVESSNSEMQNGWLRTTKRSALIRGVKAELIQWVKSNNLRVGSVIPGRIRIVENTTPAYETQSPKRAGADGPELTFEGATIYRHADYITPSNPQFNEPDVFLQHDQQLTGVTRGATAGAGKIN